MSLRDKITGGFDLLFLFGRGIEKFSGAKNEALMSLLVPLALLPPSLVFACFYPPKGMETGGYGSLQIIATCLAQFGVTFIFSNLAVWAAVRSLGQGDRFWLFFSVRNWVELPFFIIMIPFIFIAVYGVIPREEMDRIFVLFLCYSYVITACIAWRAFAINWQLAGFISIITLFVSQTLGYHLIFRIQDIPIVW